MHRKSFLLVELDGKLRSFLVMEGEVDDAFAKHDTSYDTARVARMDKAIQNWARFKVRDEASLLKVLAKHFPGFSEVPVVHDDRRLEANRIFDEGHEPHTIRYWGENRDKPAASYTSRMDADGDQITKDGIKTRFCDNHGVPYPTPPEGQRRFRIGVAVGIGSYSDYHRMWMAATPREAALQCAEYLDSPEGQGPFGFKRETIRHMHVTDLDSEETHFFVGPNCDESAESLALGAMFNQLARGLA